MIKNFLYFILLVTSLQSFSQRIIYKSNGTVLDENQIKLQPDEVRELLKNNDKLLVQYKAGRSKKTIGNVLLVGGLGLVATDLARGVFSDGKQTTTQYSVQTERNFPSALTYIGLAAVVVSIPVKIGFSKKIRNAVSEYNNQYATGYSHVDTKELNIITNANGIGLRLTLN